MNQSNESTAQGQAESGSASEASAGAGAPEDMIPGPAKPFLGPVDFAKPVRTKRGRYPVRIIAIDNSLSKPIVGVVLEEMFNDEVSTWYLNGRYTTRETTGLDLENVPEVAQ